MRLRLLLKLMPYLTGFLLGSGGTDSESGALAAYVPDRDARRALISAIADECAAAAQVHCMCQLQVQMLRAPATDSNASLFGCVMGFELHWEGECACCTI